MMNPTPITPVKRDRLKLSAPGRQVTIRATRAIVSDRVYLVETMQGEMYTAIRYPELDTNARRAWKQVHP